MTINFSDLFFTCSLIEYIGRKKKLKRSEVVNALGRNNIAHIYKKADTLHCEPIEKTADVFIDLCNIDGGCFDNIADCKYAVPDYWSIGKVYARLVEDVCGDDVVSAIMEVYDSVFSDFISNYNSDFFYQSREYIKKCYEVGEVLE